MYVIIERCTRCGNETAAAGRCQACDVMDLACTTMAATFAPRARRELPPRSTVVVAALTGVAAATCAFTLAICAWFA
jgi:hypothetical protein